MKKLLVAVLMVMLAGVPVKAAGAEAAAGIAAGAVTVQTASTAKDTAWTGLYIGSASEASETLAVCELSLGGRCGALGFETTMSTAGTEYEGYYSTVTLDITEYTMQLLAILDVNKYVSIWGGAGIGMTYATLTIDSDYYDYETSAYNFHGVLSAGIDLNVSENIALSAKLLSTGNGITTETIGVKLNF